MITAGKEYGSALYALARENGNPAEILEQLEALEELFRSEPQWYDLLTSPTLGKQERLDLIDQALRGRVDLYLVNFVKLLTERGRLRELPDCRKAYGEQYDTEHNILRVTAVTAVPLRDDLRARLEEKLGAKAGCTVVLKNRVDASVLGGVCLEYPGRQLDDTLRTRLENIHSALLQAKA